MSSRDGPVLEIFEVSSRDGPVLEIFEVSSRDGPGLEIFEVSSRDGPVLEIFEVSSRDGPVLEIFEVSSRYYVTITLKATLTQNCSSQIGGVLSTLMIIPGNLMLNPSFKMNTSCTI